MTTQHEIMPFVNQAEDAADAAKTRELYRTQTVGAFEAVREFDTGAYRDTDNHKLSYLRHLSPLVLRRYTQYLDKCRRMSDGTLREPDNWKKGMPRNEWAESLLRHVMSFWETTETGEGDVQEALCAILFNAMGRLHEELREQPSGRVTCQCAPCREWVARRT